MIRQYRCYIAQARLRRASGAIISPGPYRSLRELSLAGSVDPVIWCPPTFVGNSGIECSNGDYGFALCFLVAADFPQPQSVMPAKAGIQYAAASRIYRRLGILDRPLLRAMTADNIALHV